MVLLALPALAAPPTFVGSADDIALAQAAWTEAEACTGRTPQTGSVATLVRDLPALSGRGGLAGQASWPPKEQARIRLAPDAKASTIAHEVAHAWVNRGPSALVEGRTETLTACIQKRRPDLFPHFRDRYSELEALPDLRSWSTAGENSPNLEADLHAYLGSLRYFRAVGAVVPPERLWAEDLHTWAALETLLGAAGPKGALAAEVLAGGVAAQRAALLDLDRDGLPTLHEQLLGTDPTRHDTDGDGWWDGAPPGPTGAVPLPQTGHPVCLPMLPDPGTALVVEMGGQLGGMDIPATVPFEGKPGSLVAWSSGWQTRPGGVWARAAGAALPNPRCAMRPGLTLRAVADLPPGRLDALAGAVDLAAAKIAAVTGLPRPRIVASVEGTALYIDMLGEHVRVPAQAVLRADDDAVVAVGRQIAAVAAAQGAPQSWRDAVAGALVKAAWPDATVPYIDARPFEVTPWVRAATRCGAGWTALLAGACASPAGG